MTRSACVLVFAAGLSGCTAAPPPGAPQPRDYANGFGILQWMHHCRSATRSC